ncbi:MAG: adenine phosphoribosyltransferase [Betaproteobacteria bacterium TMED41]|nr:MAG: adenine phosphoribosyltransferase [Betaproteobacteria bacterium TMED41]
MVNSNTNEIQIHKKIKEKIRTIPNYPKPGILFRDITTLLKQPEGVFDSVEIALQKINGIEFNKVAGIDSRGFIFGAAISYAQKKGFIPIRKKNKLPSKVISEEYQLEYGVDEMELHVDAIEKDDHVLLVDDLIATGGTAGAAINLIKRLEGNVAACCFIVGLPDLGGVSKLKKTGVDVITICDFDGH